MESHHAYDQCGLGSEACDDLTERMRTMTGVGAKMTGGGGGGVVAAVCRPDQIPLLRRIAEKYAAERNAPPRLFVGSSDGVQLYERSER